MIIYIQKISFLFGINLINKKEFQTKFFSFNLSKNKNCGFSKQKISIKLVCWFLLPAGLMHDISKAQNAFY